MPPPDQQAVGNQPQRRQVHFALPIVDQVEEARIDRGIFAHALAVLLLAINKQSFAPIAEFDAELVGSPNAIVHSSPPVARQSRLAVSGPSASGPVNSASTAIGVCAFSGTCSSADLANKGPGR